jgi:rfaE bifunctional protein kinase chain/domain
VVLGLVPEADAVLFSDYGCGVLSLVVVRDTVEGVKSRGILCTVDAQGAFAKYEDVDLVKGNRWEVEAALGRELATEDDYREAGERLLRDLRVGAAIITRGAEGLSLISGPGMHVHLPAANCSEVFDVTGAGDTVVAVATLALLAGGTILTAAMLANHAAGLVVRKLGNAVPTGDELHWAIDAWQ